MVFDDVKAYIDESIFHAESFDSLDVLKQGKAVKNAEAILYTIFRHYKPIENPLPVDAIAYQTLWVILKDSSMSKAEMGIASQSIEGMTQSFTKMDRTLAPEVKRILKKKVGSYSLQISDTFRGINK